MVLNLVKCSRSVVYSFLPCFWVVFGRFWAVFRRFSVVFCGVLGVFFVVEVAVQVVFLG